MFKVHDGLRVGAIIVIDSSGNLRTAAATANALTSPQTISLTGAITGTITTDFSSPVSISTALSNTAVTPGSYTKVTVGSDGRITAGQNPTTLAGYGITDAQPLSPGLTSLAGVVGVGLVQATSTNNYSIQYVGTANATDIPNTASADLRYLQLSGGTLTGPVTLSGDPTTNLQAATKQYVDNNAQGLVAHTAVRAATAGSNITLSGLQIIDGVSLNAGDRVLVKDQTDQTTNGVYVAATGAWALASDLNTYSEFPNAYVFVQQGTVNISTGWVCNSPKAGTLGTTPITWIQFSSSTTYTATNGIVLAGTNFSLTGQALNLYNLGTTGVIVLTGNGAATTRIVTTAGTGISSSHPDGTTGNPTLSLWPTLANLAQQAWAAGTQVPVMTAGNVWALLTVGGAAGNLLDRASGDSLYTNATNIVSGTLAAAQLPAFTGDISTVLGSTVTTLATVNANTGTFGSTTQTPIITVNGKGLITDVAVATITPAWGSISGKPSTVSGYGITDAITTATYTAANVLAMVETVDGTGSGLDADLLDGQHGVYYTNASNISNGVLGQAYGGLGMGSYTANSYIRANGSSVLEQRTPSQVRADISAITMTVEPSTAPSNPNPGDLWVDSTTGSEYTWYVESGQGQWVELGPTGIYGVSGSNSNATATTISAADNSITVANAAGGYTLAVSSTYTATLNQSITNEANARVAADNALQANVSLNTNAIQSNAATLSSLSNTVTSNYSTLNSAINAETVRAEAAETSLNTNVSAVVSNVSAIQSSYVNRNGTVAMTGALNMGNNVINNVSPPVLSTDGANKQYVDNAVANTGGVAGSSPVFISPTQPVYAGNYLWIQTGTGSNGNGITFWANC